MTATGLPPLPPGAKPAPPGSIEPGTGRPLTRDGWVWLTHTHHGWTKALSTRLAKDGDDGTGKTGTDGTPQRKRMTLRTADTLRELVHGAGVAGPPGLEYLVDVLRWHLGYTRLLIRPGKLTAADAAFIRRRAWDLIDGARGELPTLTNDRPAT